ncbi:MAG TPA: 2OG-Fe(II) oxygenase [Tahibacter sp.]|nr:2OG-Fe(II) oxygenase [Tahibacter sp.]
MLDSTVTARADEYAAQFQQRDPFRHVVIENFFAPGDADRLLAEFPHFERGNARNENGTLGNKSTIEKIRDIGGAYAALDDLIKSDAFLATVSRITGIPNLLYDPWYFGGGTHESRNGQDLDAHVDFNRHPIEPWHRRLNLIVYLNHEWEPGWGGTLQLHSDPRASDNRTKDVLPLFNRAVIFETTEWSWHGFPPISLPHERADTTRRSIALYFYSAERPPEELAPTHSTIYVDRPLPERYRPGYTLSGDDVQELRILLARRDQHNQRLYRDISSLTERVENANGPFLQNAAKLVKRLVGRLSR